MRSSKEDRLLVQSLKALVEEITDDGPGIALAASDTEELGRDIAASIEDESLSIIERIRNARTVWTADNLAHVLQMSKKSIYKMAAAGRLPCYRIGGTVRFDPKATADWLETKALA